MGVDFLKVRKQLVRKIDAAMAALAEQTVAEMRAMASEPSPPPSAPGQPPHSHTGELVNSIKDTTASLQFTIFSDSPHILYTEYGTHRMAPRPLFTPTAERLRKTAAKFIASRLK